MIRIYPRKVICHLPVLLALISLACSLPALVKGGQATPTLGVGQLSTPGDEAPTTSFLPTPHPLPPAIVESIPSPEAELPLLSPVTIYFNQPMDHASVEAALNVQPSVPGSLSWNDEATLVFKPSRPLSPESQVVFTINPQARSSKGLAMPQPVSLEYRTVGYLRLSEVLPKPGAYDVDPNSAVVVAFNRPVVPLGGDPTSLGRALAWMSAFYLWAGVHLALAARSFEKDLARGS